MISVRVPLQVAFGRGECERLDGREQESGADQIGERQRFVGVPAVEDPLHASG